MKKNKKKCNNCGVIRPVKDLVKTNNGNYYCFSCWNLDNPNSVNKDLDIRIMKDGTPAIVLDQAEPVTHRKFEKELHFEEYNEDYYLDQYYYQILKHTNLTKIELDNLVKAKIRELKGLISEEGALFIIAKEFGVDLEADSSESGY
ncbi:MAG: hypothetical protein ACOC44_07805 [Promethearchaeia archaeon]